jgi:hypothetical protein
MNKFGTREMQHLIDRIRTEVIALRETDVQENGLVGVLTDAADTLDAAQRYHGAVESALV